VAEPPGYPTDQLAADINELQAELLRADGQQHTHAAEDVAWAAVMAPRVVAWGGALALLATEQERLAAGSVVVARLFCVAAPRLADTDEIFRGLAKLTKLCQEARAEGSRGRPNEV
jgi:hypothetical protein